LYSYNTSKIVKDLGKISLKDKIVIVDEAHNLFSMITSNSKIGQYIYKRFIDGVNTRFLFLSGTPIINTPYEIALMFNVLRPGIFPINVMSKDNFELYYVIQKQNRNDIKKLIYGLSSYFEGVNDKNIFPSSHRKIIKVPMTNIQKQQYKQYDKIERMPFFLKNNKSYKEDKSKNIQNMYKVYTRQVCNFPYIKESQLKSIKDSELTYNLYKYSIKYSKLINIVKRSPGPVLIYSNFKETGINLIARILDLNGITYIKWTSDESEKERELNLKNFNDKTNKHGNKIKCILITSAGAEGISLKNVRQVHIMEPHWNKNRESQVIGRAMRICSHSDLPVKERHIDIYNYYSIWDNNNIITADVVIHNLAENKYKIIKEFLELIKESAFDCEFSKEKLNCYFKVI
jgi:superfamily II DNA or RNA helicase